MALPSRELIAEILQRSGEHGLLVAIAMALALAISLPAGLWIHGHRRWSAPVLALANTIQTIPSLAVFGLLITVPLLGGIGPVPAVVALVLYALLPLLRATVTGLDGVPPGLREAGRALGLTDAQVLRHVELPLALPVIVAGIRVATVISVGVATIAAAIGGGGLGVFIFRGIATVNNGLILAGAIPAALMALLADAAIGRLQGWSPRRRPLLLVAALGGLLITLASTAALQLGPFTAGAPRQQTITIGSKSFTEQILLGELLAQQIERHSALRVKRQFSLGGTAICQEAVRSGRIDGYVEYTGTAWTTILRQPPLRNAQAVWERARRLYRQRFDLTMFPSLGFENTFAILVRQDTAKQWQLRTISDAAPHSPRWRAGFGYEFLNRPDGYAGLVRAYGLRFAARPASMDLGLTYRALAEGQVDLIAGDSTNGLINSLGLQPLRDDRHYFPPYQAVPVFNGESLRRHPALAPAIEQLSGRLDAATMRQLNAAVDLEGKPVEQVVRGYLEQLERSTPPGISTGSLTPSAGAVG
ncbi:ABC transporter permease subunit [Synechococcus sp. CS-1324]|uniref:glycine betaine ABC transporter substrate-binding protein n=1 Tax=Synechococcus sp. CS-1324 TaxID=2847980 RepID=UPI000DB737E6|nr:glycine betaine ABC transporter substrate-binding protein [Synechococcus sp. CS-1324]MCT0231013.1 ABC transporter permease subunit [Synechococcus sp. CS-1324]PZV03321.1 MAG: glycine/betaine ABC transporter substrate-binding protein [Cyanobium sp.]